MMVIVLKKLVAGGYTKWYYEEKQLDELEEESKEK